MSFTEEQIQKVWEKAYCDKNNDPNVYRKDECGAWMARNEYGNRLSNYGWEIDHINPATGGGGDELSNLRPLMWENKLSKTNGGLVCVIIAEDGMNIKAQVQ